MTNSVDPVVWFFVLGIAARLAKSDLRLPEALYETLSIFLLLAIGLKGGVELSQQPLLALAPQVAGVLLMGFSLPFLAFPALRLLRLNPNDAASIAAHYGSISIVTFAVGSSFLTRHQVDYESHMPLFAALLEAPGIVSGVLLARWIQRKQIDQDRATNWLSLAHEIFLGKSIFLLAGGLVIGYCAGPAGVLGIKPFFIDAFKGALALFLLEMGLIAGARLGDLRRAGVPLIVFGIVTPMVFGLIGVQLAEWLGFSVGGRALIGTLAASASYIAAPTAMRIAIPQANPALSIGVALGVTFPFNIAIGIPLYLRFAQALN